MTVRSHESDARFEIDVAGMRELQAGRPAFQLVKELVVNVFDEARRDDPAGDIRPTFCSVRLEHHGRREVLVEVEDNGGGFADLRDAYTIFKTTSKRGQAHVAGRFNLGEKEIVSVASWARVATRVGEIYWPPRGGREVKTAEAYRYPGTRVTLLLPWTAEERESAGLELERLIPPANLAYKVNGRDIPHREPIRSARVTLPTVIQSAPGQPLRRTARQTTLQVFDPLVAGDCWLCELGCPVQRIDLPWTVNVEQKIPLPPNRDVAGPEYVQDVCAEVLNLMADVLLAPDTAEQWVRVALEDPRTQQEAVKRVVGLRHGDRVVLWSSSPQSNEMAMEAGYTIVKSSELSNAERQAYERVGVQHASVPFKLGMAHSKPVEAETDGMRATRRFVAALAGRIVYGGPVETAFVDRGQPDYLAEMGSDRVLRFNVRGYRAGFFERWTPELQGIILHELAHLGPRDGDLPHGQPFEQRFRLLAGLAVKVALREPEVWDCWV